MRVALLAAIAAAPAVLASPQAYGYGYEHHGRHYHRPQHQPSGVLGSAGGGLPAGGASASVSGAETAPYGLGNTTIPGSTGFATGTQVLGTTVRHTVYTTVSGPSSPANSLANSLSAPLSILSGPLAGASATANEAAAGSAGPCGSGTFTTTYNPTYTVTVTQPQALTSGVSVVSSKSTILSGSEGASANSQSRESASLGAPTIVSQSVSVSVHASSDSKSITAPVSLMTASGTYSSEASLSIVPVSQSEVSQTLTTAIPIPSSTANKAITATASTASAVTVPSTKPAAGNKRGILASGPDQDALVSAFNNADKITWLCNWYSAPPQNVSSHVEFVPQDYGKESNTAPKYEWTTNAKQAIAKGAKYFLGFGEPEAPDTPTMHTNMEPQDAVTLFMSDLQPYAEQGIKIGAPAVLQPDPDLAWLKQFLGLCETAGCKISFIAIHWVWSATPAQRVQDFKTTINNATAMANGKPVWVDNFQASGTNEEQQQWLSEVLPWLESNGAVERYAYVSSSRSTGTGFLNADGSLSSLGEYYANF